MKRREIMCLLAAAGCILLLAPLRTRAANLQDLLSIGTIDTEKTADVEEEPIEEDEDREGADLFAMTQMMPEIRPKKRIRQMMPESRMNRLYRRSRVKETVRCRRFWEMPLVPV